MQAPTSWSSVYRVGHRQFGVEERALLELGHALRSLDYDFVAVTPETHRRVLQRERRLARDLRDVFGWNRAFEPALLPARVGALMQAANVAARSPSGALRSTVRFSTLGKDLLVHSSFPTTERDAVFLGPDTYRFCAFLARHQQAAARVVDVGCGSGAGGLALRRVARQVTLSDVNRAALRFARINAALADAEVEVLESDVLAGVSGKVDLVVANPPYMLDSAARAYRDGGGQWGEGLAVRIAREALSRLAPRGRLLLYSGAPIVNGWDMLGRALRTVCSERRATLSYEELDPDVFGDELLQPGYERVERIAAVGACITLP